MSTQNVRNTVSQLISDIGRSGANAIFPNDIEYYAISLELTDSRNQTVEYLTFPVSPSNINYDDTKIATVTKTFGGTSSLDNETFVPKTIQLSGTFGRKLRLLLSPSSNKSVNSTQGGVFDNIQNQGLQIKTSILNAKIKSGYGTTKLLESILTKASGLDEYNEPNRLYLYIPPLGHNFLVKCVGSLNLHQDYQSSNMMWRYNFTLMALSKIQNTSTINPSSLVRATTMNALQKATNNVLSKVTSIL